MNLISTAVTGNFDWSVQYAKSLNEEKLLEPDFWRALVTGWKNADLAESKWLQVLNILRESRPILDSVTYEVSQLLDKGINKTAHRIPMAHLPLSISLSEMIWDVVVGSAEANRCDQAEDWLQLAINHPAGSLLTFRLRALSLIKEAAGENWSEIPLGEKSFLESVLLGTSHASSVGRVLIASQLYFLFNLDQTWTAKKLIPLFDLAENELRAIQAWHGFLVWGRLAESLLPHLLPCFEQAFPYLHVKFGKEQRQSFCQFLAGIACYGSTDPIQSGLLDRFLREVTLEERIMWSSSMSQTLKSMKDPLLQNAWRNWINIYWQNRIDGVPMPLEVGEIAEMVEWALAFKASFPAVAEKIYRSPKPKVEHGFVYKELSESEIIKLHPEAAAALVLYLLKIDFAPVYWFEPLVKIVEDLKSFDDAKHILREICGELARLGYPGAGNLRDTI